MKVPFLDLCIQETESKVLHESIGRVFKHGKLVMGPEIDQFESLIAKYCNRNYAISVNSGTDALFMALRALDINSNHEVVTTSLSWIATANAIKMCGATPIFADIEDDLNINPQSVEKLISRKTKAILVVNYTGRICRIHELIEIAQRRDILLVEDGSQSFGASYNKEICGSFGSLSAISHNPMKVFAACGEAGSILCDDSQLRERLISLRYNGTINKETCLEPSLNGRMDTIQAAILIERLKSFPTLISKRRTNAKFYDKYLEGFVGIPPRTDANKDVFYTYTIRSSKRDQLKFHLEKRGVETKIQHSQIIPKQPAYKTNAEGEWKNAEKLSKEILSIPINETLSKGQLQYVVDQIKSFGPSLPI
jgi:dTDP-4-amino-4,6-dideoxygalactose transaminase